MKNAREFYNAVIASDVAQELKDYAAEAIAKLDAANEKRKNKVSKKAEENAPIKEAILAVLTTEAQTTADIAAQVEISTPKASALLRQLVADGKVVVTDVKVPKKGACKAYSVEG